jgi:hypothetical protein
MGMLAFRKSVPPKGKIHAPSFCRGGRGNGWMFHRCGGCFVTA